MALGRIIADPPANPRSATWRLVEHVRAELQSINPGGPVSDYRISKELGVAPSTVAHWRRGRQMDDAQAVAAATLAKVNPLEWVLRVAADRETDGDLRSLLADVVTDLDRLNRRKEPRRDGLLWNLIHGAAQGIGAAIVTALALLGSPQPAQAHDVMSRAYVIDRFIYYAQMIRRFCAALQRAGRRVPAMVTR